MTEPTFTTESGNMTPSYVVDVILDLRAQGGRVFKPGYYPEYIWVKPTGEVCLLRIQKRGQRLTKKMQQSLATLKSLGFKVETILHLRRKIDQTEIQAVRKLLHVSRAAIKQSIQPEVSIPPQPVHLSFEDESKEILDILSNLKSHPLAEEVAEEKEEAREEEEWHPSLEAE